MYVCQYVPHETLVISHISSRLSFLIILTCFISVIYTFKKKYPNDQTSNFPRTFDHGDKNQHFFWGPPIITASIFTMLSICFNLFYLSRSTCYLTIAWGKNGDQHQYRSPFLPQAMVKSHVLLDGHNIN